MHVSSRKVYGGTPQIMALLVQMLQERNLLKYKGLFESFCICEDVLYGLNCGLFLRKVLWASENLYSLAVGGFNV